MAVNGSDWGSIFCRENSGTYNNQWMVVDFNVIHREALSSGKAVGFAATGSLQVIEQMPNMCINRDQSAFADNQTYWSSFNRPFYREMYEWAGTKDMFDLHGDYFSYYENYRRLIFARNQSNVVDVATMQELIRYNNYLHDPLSIVPYKAGNNCSGFPTRNAETSISARSDLTPIDSQWCDLTFDIGAQNMAGIDGKVISLRDTLANGFSALSLVNGPMNGGLSNIPVFQWNTSFYGKLVPHLGMPNTFNFPWVNGQADVLGSIQQPFPAYATTNLTLEVVYNVPASDIVDSTFAALVLSLVQIQVSSLSSAEGTALMSSKRDQHQHQLPSFSSTHDEQKKSILRLLLSDIASDVMIQSSDSATVEIVSKTALTAVSAVVSFRFDGLDAVRNTIIFAHTLNEEFSQFDLSPVPPAASNQGNNNDNGKRDVAIAVGCSVGAVLAAVAIVIYRRSSSRNEGSDASMKDVPYAKLDA
jgi:hypothetical protein